MKNYVVKPNKYSAILNHLKNYHYNTANIISKLVYTVIYTYPPTYLLL